MAGGSSETQGSRLPALTRSPRFHCCGTGGVPRQRSRAALPRWSGGQRWARCSGPSPSAVRALVQWGHGPGPRGRSWLPRPGLQPLFSASAGVTGVLVSGGPGIASEEVPRLLETRVRAGKWDAGLLGTFCVLRVCFFLVLVLLR